MPCGNCFVDFQNPAIDDKVRGLSADLDWVDSILFQYRAMVRKQGLSLPGQKLDASNVSAGKPTAFRLYSQSSDLSGRSCALGEGVLMTH